MKVLNFIRENENWEEVLTAAPYNIKVSRKGPYVLLKYNQLSSDFNEEIVRECRGCILFIPFDIHSLANVVCYAFDKFGNYGESYVPHINWESAKVKEKVDGSLIKVWYHCGEWHVSTNGAIDAQDAATSVEGVSFYNVFMRALEKNGDPDKFFQSLDPNYTYMFELVSPETRVTIEYPDTTLYYLGARNMIHLIEVEYPNTNIDRYFFPFVKLPKVYPLSSLEQCIKAVNLMSKNEEGFVVCDTQFNRVKIKSPEYLIAARLRNNGAITIKRVVEMIRSEQIDDFYAYVPQYQSFIDNILKAYNNYIEELNQFIKVINITIQKGYTSKKFAKFLKNNNIRSDLQGFAFAYFNGKTQEPQDYINRLSFNKLIDIIKMYLDNLK